ncbi:hypothetical protein ABHZ27_09025 [Bacteroides uniformis]
MLFKAEHPLKASVPIDFTLLGITTLTSSLQSINVLSSIEVTLLGIMIFFRLVQLWNALAPIEETLLGIWISISPLQLVNALSLINVDPSDNVILRFSQSEKRALSKRFPDMAMVRSALFLKAWLPIEVTVSGIVIVRWEQYSYLQPIITQYFIDNKSEIWLLFLIAHSKR